MQYARAVEREDGDAIRHWAEVVYVPSDDVVAKDRPVPPRYLALRITKKQGRLFTDGGEVKHFAIVTNLPDPDGGTGLDLICWQRGKAGITGVMGTSRSTSSARACSTWPS